MAEEENVNVPPASEEAPAPATEETTAETADATAPAEGDAPAAAAEESEAAAEEQQQPPADADQQQEQPNEEAGGVGADVSEVTDHHMAVVNEQGDEEGPNANTGVVAAPEEDQQVRLHDQQEADDAAPGTAGTGSTGAHDEQISEQMVEDMGGAEATLTVRFNVQPQGFFFIQNFPPNAPALVMYHRIEKHLRVERRTIRMYWDGRPLTEMDRISDVCVLPDDGLPLVIDVEFDGLPPHLRILGNNEQATRSIEVEVEYGDDIPSKQFYVTLVKKYDRKPFLGGYRHTKTGAVFHHTATQTMVEREIRTNMVGKLSRMTQTQGVTRSTQTRRECGTQMPRSDLLVDETYDRIVIAKPYFSAERLLSLQVQKAVRLQAFLRGWRARKIAAKLREERDEEELALLRENERRQKEHHEKKQKEIDRRTHPRTKQDFAVLYNELEAWRLQEVARIKAADVPEAEKKVAMQELLKKETKLLQTIDRLQIQASKENRTRRIETTLNKMSSAKSWGTQSAVTVETPFTIRARELRDLYNALQLNGLSVDERLDILLHVKWTVKELSCPLSREIVELVDREADLLNRGRKENALLPLRQRMCNLMLQFIETPEFNPEAIQYQRVPLEYTSRPLVRLDKKQR